MTFRVLAVMVVAFTVAGWLLSGAALTALDAEVTRAEVLLAQPVGEPVVLPEVTP